MSKYITHALFFLGMLACFQCTAPSYVPNKEEITTSLYGAAIKIQNLNGKSLEGELLAANNDKLVMLMAKDGKYLVVEESRKNIRDYVVRYAQPVQYGWTIPLYTIFCASHGVFAVFTAPTNIIVTSAITASGANSFSLNSNELGFSKLAQFARFPQGIPPNVTYKSIEEVNYTALGNLVINEDAGLNGDFEIVQDDTPVNWMVGSRSLNSRVELSQNSAKTGTNCLYFHTGTTDYKINNEPAITQVVSVDRNSEYILKFYVKSVKMPLEVKLGDPYSEKHNSLKVLRTKPNNADWVYYELTFKTSELQGALRIEFTGMYTGEAWLDEISLTKI